MRNAECGIARSVNSVHGAEAPLAPSEEGAVKPYRIKRA